nr:hypothetical protein [candidate division Zixibacteria bacterium]
MLRNISILFLVLTIALSVAWASGRHKKTSVKSSADIQVSTDAIRHESPGYIIGQTYYDEQSMGRMGRQIDWRNDQIVRMTWTSIPEPIINIYQPTSTKYEIWDADLAALSFQGSMGGCNISSPVTLSGYGYLDVTKTGKVVIATNYLESDDSYDEYELRPTIHYEAFAYSCYFSPYRTPVPDIITGSNVPSELYAPYDHAAFLWPSIEYQVLEGDIVTHIFARMNRLDGASAFIHYFRRLGGPTDSNYTWDYPAVVIDTTRSYSNTVTSSRTSGKAALIWLAPPPEIPGSAESQTRDMDDPSLGSSLHTNDVYYMISNDMGASWGAKHNISGYDSSVGGYLASNDISALIDTDDYLHIVWNARKAVPNGYSLGDWENYYGGRLFHWGENYNLVRTIKDAGWAEGEQTCTGGEFNNMYMVKPMISECAGKFYTIFVQFNDYQSGIDDDCHQDYFTSGDWDGTADGEVYLCVSDNGGLNWDVARNLSNSYSPNCSESGSIECESDMWPSISRYGMTVTDGDFTGVPVVDPSGSYSGNQFLDVLYINDKHPGSCLRDAGVWTLNPVKWFRVPCVDPSTEPPPPPDIADIGFPTWTSPGVQLDTTLHIENFGSSDLVMSSIDTEILSGPAGWLEVGNHGPIIISGTTPNYYDLDVYLNYDGVISSGTWNVEGYILINYDMGEGVTDTVKVDLIVVDDLPFPEFTEIRTECKALILDNSGNFGNDGYSPFSGYGGKHLNFFDDCDTTDNNEGSDDNALIYVYTGSPFVLRINESGDTIINYDMRDGYWGSPKGFYPQTAITVDSTSFPEFRYVQTGRFITYDSAVAMRIEYYAPKSPDSCDFLVLRHEVYNNTDHTLNGVYIGDIIDFDIPSDSIIDNGSGYDAVGGDESRDLMYQYGAEYGPDATANNDCVPADARMGGLAFYNGYKIPFRVTSDSLQNPAGPWWTHRQLEWFAPTGGIVPGAFYRKIASMGTSWETWEAVNPGMPDSMYQDLFTVAVYGKFNLKVGDTLVFVKILATEYDGGLAGLQQSIDEARNWIANAPAPIFEWPEGETSCCVMMGDINNNGIYNILDITYLLNYLYKEGPAPPCPAHADVNCSCSINILDITCMIGRLYTGTCEFCTCEQWVDKCGDDPW